MNDRPGLDDPLWEHILRTRLEPYIPYVRDWWSKIEYYTISDVGIQELKTDSLTKGLHIRFTRTAVRSPIKGIQAFPFIPTGYLQISGIQGGTNKMIERVCRKGLEIDEFRIVEKHNLPSTFQQGQFVAFIPSKLFNETKKLGVWLYFNKQEINELANGKLPKSIVQKAILKM